MGLLMFVLLNIMPYLNIFHRDTLTVGEIDTLKIEVKDSSGIPLSGVKILIKQEAPQIILLSDTLLYSDSDGEVVDTIYPLKTGKSDIYITAIHLQDTVYDTTSVLVFDSIQAFVLTLYPARRSITSDEIDTIYAILYSKDSIVAGRPIHFHIIEGVGWLSSELENTDIHGKTWIKFYPRYTDTVYIEGYYLDDLNRKIADTVIIFVQTGYRDTLELFVDSLFFYPSPVGTKYPRASIEYLTPSVITHVEVRILDPFGNTVYVKTYQKGQQGAIPKAWNRVCWDGKNNRGRRVASGMYILVVRMYNGSAVKRQLVKRIGVEW